MLSDETHDDVIKWNHFPRYWPFVRGIHRSPVNSPHKGQWRGAKMFSLICAWINDSVNSREAGDSRRYRAHYDVIVMKNNCYSWTCVPITFTQWMFFVTEHLHWMFKPAKILATGEEIFLHSTNREFCVVDISLYMLCKCSAIFVGDTEELQHRVNTSRRIMVEIRVIYHFWY